MSKKKTCECLMIETKENLKFFTPKKNLVDLAEFSKTFGAEISVVQVKEAEVLDLIDLAPAICNAMKMDNPEFTIVETKIKKSKVPRKKILKIAQKIRQYIEEILCSGEIIELKNISQKFKSYNLTLGCFCNHLRELRKTYISQGKTIQRVGHGKYRMINSPK